MAGLGSGALGGGGGDAWGQGKGHGESKCSRFTDVVHAHGERELPISKYTCEGYWWPCICVGVTPRMLQEP